MCLDHHRITRYLTWADIDMLNQNYNCPVEYAGTEGTIQSHEEYPLLNYNKTYRWGNHTGLGYSKM